MHWIAPTEKNAGNAALEKRHSNAAEQGLPASHLANAAYKIARLEGFLGLIFLRLAEVRFAVQCARMKTEYNLPAQINHH